jgi:hypothetical protein
MVPLIGAVGARTSPVGAVYRADVGGNRRVAPINAPH